MRVVASLKTQQPDWRISWIVRDIFAAMVRVSTLVDQIYIFRRQGSLSGFWQLSRELRKKEFDVVIDMQGLLRTGLMTQRAHALRKIGRSDAREGACFFYTEKVPLPPTGRQSHAVEQLLQFLPTVGAKAELQGRLEFREMEKLNLGFMEPWCGKCPILIFPDSRRKKKKWNGFVEFSEMLIREAARKVVWAGDAYIACREKFPDNVFFNLTGNTSLKSLAAIIARSDWIISNDSGPMHLSAAVGVKTIGIFGPTDPKLYGPYPLNSPTNYVIQAPVGDLRLLSPKEAFFALQTYRTSGRDKAIRKQCFRRGADFRLSMAVTNQSKPNINEFGPVRIVFN